MAELRYPNESKEYRKARAALLKDERKLVEQTKALAKKRRKLPPGGQLKEDYTFQWANDGKVGQRVKFSELFGDKDTLLLYSFMFGPGWDKPCMSCTSLMDGFDRAWYSVSQDAAFAAIAKAPARPHQRLGEGARLVADPAAVRSGVAVPGGLQVPGRQRRHAVAGDAFVQEAPRQDFPVLEHRGDDEPRRYGVAVLEFDGLHGGGKAGPGDTAAEVHVGVPGEEFFE